jgi:hypothetical protein
VAQTSTRPAAKASKELAETGADGADGTDQKVQFSNLGHDYLEHDTMFHKMVIGAAGNQRLVRTV